MFVGNIGFPNRPVQN